MDAPSLPPPSSSETSCPAHRGDARPSLPPSLRPSVQDDAWIATREATERRGRRRRREGEGGRGRERRGAQNEELSADVIMAGSGGGALPGYFLGAGSSGNGPRIRSISLLPHRSCPGLHPRLERDEHTHDISREISGQGNIASRRVTLDTESRNT